MEGWGGGGREAEGGLGGREMDGWMDRWVTIFSFFPHPSLPADSCPSLTPSGSRLRRGGVQVRKATPKSLGSDQTALWTVAWRAHGDVTDG